MGKRHLKDCTIYAVDFDGTLCTPAFPGIGRPNDALINYLKEKREKGDKLILWTNRMGEYLDNAVSWCRGQGLEFDAVNDNIPEIIEQYEHILRGKEPSRKITADVFIDDAAVSCELPFGTSTCPLEKCWHGQCIKKSG